MLLAVVLFSPLLVLCALLAMQTFERRMLGPDVIRRTPPRRAGQTTAAVVHRGRANG